LNSLASAPGTPPEAIRNLLRAQAAISILENPANAVLPPGDLDPIIAEAIQAGAEQAAALTAAGKHLRLVVENLPLGTAIADLPEHRTERIGPFSEPAGRLARFVTIESATFVQVNARLPPGFPQQQLLLMLIPPGATPSADRKTWQIPEGSVWIQARFFVANAAGFVGVRCTGGTLTFDQNLIGEGGFLLSPGTGWKLSLDLEQPPASAVGGSDAEALQLQLPIQLNISTSAAANIVGDISLSGFG